MEAPVLANPTPLFLISLVICDTKVKLGRIVFQNKNPRHWFIHEQLHTAFIMSGTKCTLFRWDTNCVPGQALNKHESYWPVLQGPFHRDSRRSCPNAQKKRFWKATLVSSSVPNSPFQAWGKDLVLLYIHKTVLKSSKMKLGTCASTTWSRQEGRVRYVLHDSPPNKRIEPAGHARSTSDPNQLPSWAGTLSCTALWAGKRRETARISFHLRVLAGKRLIQELLMYSLEQMGWWLF